MVEKFGDPCKLQCSGKSIWEHDPSYAELAATLAESDRLNNASADLIEQMMATQAATLCGLLAKMQAGMKTWAPTKPAD